MAGYNPNDPEDRRTTKAAYFFKSMIQKGQPRDEALRIASRYYHVEEKAVLNLTARDKAEEDDDVYFLLGGSIVVSASEMFDPGDFC